MGGLSCCFTFTESPITQQATNTPTFTRTRTCVNALPKIKKLHVGGGSTRLGAESKRRPVVVEPSCVDFFWLPARLFPTVPGINGGGELDWNGLFSEALITHLDPKKGEQGHKTMMVADALTGLMRS